MTHFLNEEQFETFNQAQIKENPLRTFDDVIINFLHDLSKEILNDKSSRIFPDLMTFGFYCRNSNILNIKNRFYSDLTDSFGMGSCVHIAPSNIPINFAFSFVFGLISGNTNFVRIPSKQFPQNEILIQKISKLLKSNAYYKLAKRNIFFTSTRNSRKLEELISNAKAIVVWGGDVTVNFFKSLKKDINCKELYFPNKSSSLVISSKEMLKSNITKKILKNFYNDTFLVDQNACSSPTNIFWIGNKQDNSKAKKEFWIKLQCFLEENNHSFKTNLMFNKHLSLMSAINENLRPIPIKILSNEIWLSSKKTIDANEFRLGLFNNINIENLSEINKYLRENEQTLTYFGFSKPYLRDNLFENASQFYRVVPMGKALDINVVWDGKDIIRELSRQIVID